MRRDTAVKNVWNPASVTYSTCDCVPMQHHALPAIEEEWDAERRGAVVESDAGHHPAGCEERE